jgi:hypothetical protein
LVGAARAAMRFDCWNAAAVTCASDDLQRARTRTTTSVMSSMNPSVFGQTVTFTATVDVVAPGYERRR